MNYYAAILHRYLIRNERYGLKSRILVSQSIQISGINVNLFHLWRNGKLVKFMKWEW